MVILSVPCPRCIAIQFLLLMKNIQTLLKCEEHLLSFVSELQGCCSLPNVSFRYWYSKMMTRTSVHGGYWLAWLKYELDFIWHFPIGGDIPDIPAAILFDQFSEQENKINAVQRWKRVWHQGLHSLKGFKIWGKEVCFSRSWKSVKTEWDLWKFVNFVVFRVLGKK